MRIVKLIYQIGKIKFPFSPFTDVSSVFDENGNSLKDFLLYKSDFRTILGDSLVGKGDFVIPFDDAVGKKDGLVSAKEIRTIVEILTAAIADKDEQIKVLSQQVYDLSHKVSEQEKVVSLAIGELKK